MFDRITQEIKRQGFSICPYLLSVKEVSEANEFFLRHSTEFQAALVGPATNKKRVQDIRGDYTYWLGPDNAPQEFGKLFDFLNELKNELNKNLFLGLRDYEAHLALYPVGSFYTRHLDRHEKKSTRVLSFVFYLNEEWKDGDGGELILYDKNNHEILKLKPDPGTFICFLSEDFPHEVKIATRERRSFTGWIHSTQLS